MLNKYGNVSHPTELNAYVYQGKLKKDTLLDFGGHSITLEKNVEFVITIVKRSDDD